MQTRLFRSFWRGPALDKYSLGKAGLVKVGLGAVVLCILLAGIRVPSVVAQAAVTPEILTRGPSTLYTDQQNPVAVERIVVRVPAYRAASRAVEGSRDAETRAGAVTLSVWRVSGHAGATTPPIYVLPDWSARGVADSAAREELLAAAAVFGPEADIYLVEPRGIGDAEANYLCPGTFSAPLSRSVDRNELTQLTARYLADCLRWWREAGMDVAAFTLEAMAGDVSDVALLLEHDDIHAVGVGMGALVALHAAQIEDTPLARAILLRPPGLRSPVLSPQGLDELLGALARRAAVAPSLYSLVPDLEGLVDRVTARLTAAPVAATVVDPVTGQTEVIALGVDDLQMAVGAALAAGEANSVPLRLFEMVQGDFRWLGEQALVHRRAVQYDLAAVAALCFAEPDATALETLQAQAAEAVLGWGAFQLIDDACDPLRPLAQTEGVSTPAIDFELVETPLLFVTGDLDGRTATIEVNTLATRHLVVDDLLIDNWAGRLDSDFLRQATPILRDFLADDYEAIPLVATALEFDALTARPFTLPAWQAEYYPNRDLTGDPVLARTDAAIDFEWGADPPDPSLVGDAFSARWSQQVELPAGIYRFYAWSDDGARLWIDNVLVLDAWQEGPLRVYRADVNLVQGLHDIRYEYFDAGGNALARLRTAYVTAYPDWVAAYYPNIDLAGEPVVVRNETTPNAFWGAGAPAPGVPAGNFSARWTSQQVLEPGAYAFRVTANGGVRLYVNEELVIDAWENVGRRLLEANRLIAGDGPTELRLEYFVVGGAAELSARWLQRPAPVGPQLVVRGPTRALTTAPMTMTADITPEGSRQVTGILWDMGDSTQYTEEDITHSYRAPGIYDITLVVTDSAGIVGGISRQVRIDDETVAPETARGPLVALAGPTVVEADAVVDFDAGGSLALNPIVRYRWEFGDGTVSDAAWVQKVFERPGVYNVRLRLEDDEGLTASRSQLVLVLAQPRVLLPLRAPMPELAFETPSGPIVVSPSTGDATDGVPEAVVIAIIAEQAVLFDVAEDGTLVTDLPVNQSIVLDARPSLPANEETPITGFLWDIADGFSTTTDPVIELVFAAAGTYAVVVTVTDAEDGAALRRIILNVVE
ncbi:MAG: PA14 domain-containing protein [Litorilinea sp.]